MSSEPLTEPVPAGPAPAAPSPGPLSPAENRRVRLLTVGAVALVSLIAFESLAVSTVMPAVAAALDGLPLYALGFGATVATSVVGMAVCGAWADARGPRRPILAAVALFTAGLLLAGLAPTMTVFVAARALQGLGGGMLIVALYAMLGTSVPEPARPRVLAAFSAAWVVPGLVGPSLAGLMLHLWGWRSVFLLVPAVAIPGAVLTLVTVRDRAPDDDPTQGGPADGDRGGPPRRSAGVGRRIALATVAGTGATVLQLAGSRDSAPWRAGAVLALVVVLAAAVRMLPAGTFRLVRGVPSVVALRGLIAAGFAAGETFVPLVLVREHGWSPTRAGLALTVGAVTWAAFSFRQGRVPEVDRRYGFARTGSVSVAIGLVVALTCALPGAPGWLAVLAWAFAGAGMGLAYASTSLLTLHLAAPERRGEASADLTTSEALTTAVALAAAGAVFAALLPRGLGPDDPAGPAPYLAAFGVAVVVGLGSVVAARRLRTPSAPQR
ncbi:MFS transporter [Kineosporia sp. A_224]|uniref:MFS transporter n=1 Tax=Kineosporia sp. A_224 TaxID=1962180 RepID=UPI000B4BCA8C|nr:MFS transporter [Kineosporia sp. A_224]